MDILDRRMRRAEEPDSQSQTMNSVPSSSDASSGESFFSQSSARLSSYIEEPSAKRRNLSELPGVLPPRATEKVFEDSQTNLSSSSSSSLFAPTPADVPPRELEQIQKVSVFVFFFLLCLYFSYIYFQK